MLADFNKLNTEAHVVRVKSHMTLLEEEQQQFEELPNILEDMNVDEGQKLDKTVVTQSDL